MAPNNREIQLTVKAVVDQAIAGVRALRVELEQLQRLQGVYQGAGAAAQQAGNAAGQAAQQANQQGADWQKGIGGIAFAFNNVVGSIQTLAATARPAFDLLIGQSIEYRESLLSMQATLASTNDVLQGGVVITDPAKAIDALEGPVSDAIAQLRKDSLSLAGITSRDLLGVFDVVAANISAIGGDLQKAEKLSIATAAGLTTWKIPIAQANQEIRSILSGQITSDSLLARQLNLRNADVEKLKQSGQLYDELIKRLSGAVAGQEKLAKTFNGVSSNIEEIFQETLRIAGEPLLDPIVDGLNEIYEYLQLNQDAILAFTKSTTEGLLRISQDIGRSLGPALDATVDILKQAAPVARDLFFILAQGASTTLAALGPLAGMLGQIIAKATEGIGKITELLLLNQINDAADAIQELTNSSNSLTGETSRTVLTLKQLNEARANGQTLTEQQLKKEEALRQRSQGLVQALNSQIAAYKQIPAVSSEVQAQRDAEIANLENLKKALMGQGQEVVLQGKKAAILGDTYKQLDEKASGALRAIESGGEGIDSAQLQQQAQTLIEATQQQLELGKITEQEAKRRLQVVSDSQAIEFKTQLASRKAIAKVRQDSSDQEIESTKIQISQTEAALATGNVNEIEGTRTLTQLKLDELRKRIAQQQEILKNSPEGSVDAKKAASQVRSLNAQLLKETVSGRKQVAEAETKALQIQQSQTQLAVESGQISELDGAKKLTELRTAEIQKRLSATAKGSNEEKQLQVDLAKTRLEGRKQVAEAEVKAIQIQSAQVEVAAQNGQISEIEAARRTTALREAEIQKRLSAVAKGSNEEKQLQVDLAKARVDGRKQVADIEAKAIQAQTAVVENLIASGATGEIEGERELTNLKQLEIEKRLSVVAKGSVEETQLRTELERSQIESLKRIQQIKLQEIERAEGRASDAIASAEVERQTQIQRLINSGQLKREDAEAENLKLARDRINGELAAERDKLAALQALPTGGTAAEQEEQENRIRDSKRRTAELTRDILKNEEDQQQALTDSIQRQIDKRTAAQQNIFTETQQSFEAQAQALDIQSKSLENQNRLLEERKSLSQALDSFVQNEFKLLGELTTSESKRKQIQEAAAKLRVQSLLREQELTRQSKELEFQKERSLLEQEKIRNRIAQIQNQADTAQTEADIAKARADKNTSPEQLRALELVLEKKQEQEGTLAAQGVLLDEQGARQAASEANRRQELLAGQATTLDSANAEAIGAIASPRRRRREQREFQQQLLDRFGGRGQFEAGIKATNTGFDRTPTAAINPFLPAVGPIATLPTASPQGVRAAQGPAEAVLKQQLDALKNAGTTVNQDIQLQIVNQLTGADVNSGAVGKQTEEAGRKLFDTVLKKAEQARFSRSKF
ncbi:hypothetical protein NDA01_24125 [Trichocoleus desertorum AS-A10]|uniref:hypothetical protein n=1 Tax=Trichocoleus desertorum TaxID=1481672 RepID=UPI00329841C4